MKTLKDMFAIAGLTAFVAVGLGCAVAEKITGREIMGPKTGF